MKNQNNNVNDNFEATEPMSGEANEPMSGAGGEARTGAAGEAKSGSSTSAKMARETSGGQEDLSLGTSQGASGGADENLGAKAKDAADSIVTQAKATASDAYTVVADKASEAIDSKKSELSVGLIGVADTVRQISSTISEGETKNGVTEYASQYVETAAAKLEGVAEYFDSADLRQMARDVESYARRNPAVFLGAAFTLGVLAARFIRSSPPNDASANGAEFENGAYNTGSNQNFETASAS